MSITDLPIQQYEERASPFFGQTELDMCYSTCLANTLNDLGRRKEIDRLKYSLKKMNEMCGYKRWYYCDDAIIPRVMNEQLEPHGYIWKELYAPTATIDILRNIASRETNSSPLVNVSSRYFEQLDIRVQGQHKCNHVLVVMGVNHTEIYYHDPCETYFKGRNIPIKRIMPIERFTSLWDEAHMSRWVAWAEPTPTQQERLKGSYQMEG